MCQRLAGRLKVALNPAATQNLVETDITSLQVRRMQLPGQTTLHQCTLLERRRTHSYLDDAFEPEYPLRDVAVEEAERFDMLLFLELSQLLHTLVGSLLEVDRFNQVALLEKAETVAVVAEFQPQPMQHSSFENALVLHIAVELAPHAFESIVEIQSEAVELLIFAEGEPQRQQVGGLVVFEEEFTVV
jgi:hypothetical protein